METGKSQIYRVDPGGASAQLETKGWKAGKQKDPVSQLKSNAWNSLLLGRPDLLSSGLQRLHVVYTPWKATCFSPCPSIKTSISSKNTFTGTHLEQEWTTYFGLVKLTHQINHQTPQLLLFK